MNLHRALIRQQAMQTMAVLPEASRLNDAALRAAIQGCARTLVHG
jgi:hypothetical protein